MGSEVRPGWMSLVTNLRGLSATVDDGGAGGAERAAGLVALGADSALEAGSEGATMTEVEAALGSPPGGAPGGGGGGAAEVCPAAGGAPASAPQGAVTVT